MASELEALRARVAALEDALGLCVTFPPEWGLTPNERRMLGMLVTRPAVPRTALMTAIYGYDNPPFDHTLTVFAYRIRRKLKAQGLKFPRARQYGHYHLDPETRGKILAILKEQNDGLRISA